MKKVIIIITTILTLGFPQIVSAQEPPHPNGGGSPGTGNTPVGGTAGAPVGGGSMILFLLAVSYAGVKIYRNHPDVKPE